MAIIFTLVLVCSAYIVTDMATNDAINDEWLKKFKDDY